MCVIKGRRLKFFASHVSPTLSMTTACLLSAILCFSYFSLQSAIILWNTSSTNSVYIKVYPTHTEIKNGR
jgi:hypothetical protein